ncbi:MAG: hypothetical protein P1V19_21120 [Gimesia sp.]|nr:hypothetical protein [Gimesia sp.]
MNIMPWLFTGCFLTAASTVPLTSFLIGTVIVLLGFLLTLSVTHFDEGHLGVKFILMREAWLKAGDTWLNGDRNASQCVRYASIKYETAGTGAKLTGEDFQNTETFMVVRSSVFVKSSAQNTHLARDAYNA